MNTIPRVPFAQHMQMMRGTWRQGEHVLIAAPTGNGKTSFMAPLVRVRSHVVVFLSKPSDPTIRESFGREWSIYRKWKDIPASETRALLWPKPGKTLTESADIQRDVFRDALNAVGREGNRTVVIDELHYATDRQFLNLGAEIAILSHQGRSSGITLVELTQRPANIPVITYSSVTHAYIARTRNAEDARKLADLGGIDWKVIRNELAALPSRFDFLYLAPQTDNPAAIVNSHE